MNFRRNKTSGDLYTEFFYCGDYTPGAGVGFGCLDLKELTPDGSEHTTKHQGWAKVEMYRYINQTAENDTEITSVLTKYYHKKTGLNGILTLSGSGPSISITKSDNYDWNEDQATFEWPK